MVTFPSFRSWFSLLVFVLAVFFFGMVFKILCFRPFEKSQVEYVLHNLFVHIFQVFQVQKIILLGGGGDHSCLDASLVSCMKFLPMLTYSFSITSLWGVSIKIKVDYIFDSILYSFWPLEVSSGCPSAVLSVCLKLERLTFSGWRWGPPCLL